MSLENLSGIKDAESSPSVEELFSVIRNAVSNGIIEADEFKASGIDFDEMREDIVIESGEKEKEIIRRNFPEKQNGYLAVPRIVD